MPHAALLVSTLLNGCAAPLQSERLRAEAPGLPSVRELAAVPFFPQDAYQCGPAALATVLTHSGAAVSPEALAPQVYLPERRGSLALELIAASRRYDRIAYRLAPTLRSLIEELAAGNPILVLQNLGLAWAPQWHFAVVVDVDVVRDEVVLRSGEDARRVTPLALFERTWRRADYWAIVVLAPDRLPRTAEELAYLKAVAELERLGRARVAATAYETALTRWPRSLGAHIGLGNSLHALGDWAGAERAFRAAIASHPESAAAHNNLAQTLADGGRLADALSAAQKAVHLGGREKTVYKETLEAIRERLGSTRR